MTTSESTAFRWEPQERGSFWAYCGEHIIGMVVPRRDGTVVWDIAAVSGSRYQAATRGEVSSIAQAKRSFRRAWRTWLTERGLTEITPPSPTDGSGVKPPPDLAELQRQLDGYRHHLDQCEQIAGKALGYPWFKDDQKNFPGATEANGVCIGDHVGDSIVEELARAYEAVRAERDALKAAMAANAS